MIANHVNLGVHDANVFDPATMTVSRHWIQTIARSER